MYIFIIFHQTNLKASQYENKRDQRHERAKLLVGKTP
jgi:hypothetical protein